MGRWLKFFLALFKWFNKEENLEFLSSVLPRQTPKIVQSLPDKLLVHDKLDVNQKVVLLWAEVAWCFQHARLWNIRLLTAYLQTNYFNRRFGHTLLIIVEFNCDSQLDNDPNVLLPGEEARVFLLHACWHSCCLCSLLFFFFPWDLMISLVDI